MLTDRTKEIVALGGFNVDVYQLNRFQFLFTKRKAILFFDLIKRLRFTINALAFAKLTIIVGNESPI